MDLFCLLGDVYCRHVQSYWTWLRWVPNWTAGKNISIM